jgi:signal transduction histidine kinase
LDKLSYLPNINQIERNINIEQVCPWYGDKGRLITILDNLISNSLQYYNRDIPNPFVNINVKVMPDAITIKIEDNGIGIEEKYLDKIFDMFYRVSSLSQGSGLGLYIVKETLEKLSGDINVVSKLEKGTTVTVSLRNSL